MKKVIAVLLMLALVVCTGFAFAGEMARDNRFIAYDNGTVLDTWTDLMWAVRDNGSHVNWREAKSYCDNYRRGGYTDWRMPTQDELAGLYDTSKGYTTACGAPARISGLIRLTCFTLWASDTDGSDAAVFQFVNGWRKWQSQADGHYMRALPVRSGK